ncbi:hypothetical protein QUF88_15980 [Bacillus sp. DX1.1]|nr:MULTISPECIES: hypothetical protein [unclassified Bacillus (in: firmicutes)]MDM5155250.1 hypothetical protein [Bacillus sp. DX1.1]WJE79570.1 hypothetical protein QRE67_13480 [Bacillus sp. DX3.1]
MNENFFPNIPTFNFNDLNGKKVTLKCFRAVDEGMVVEQLRI